jgi:lactoylglutathione lyase
MFERNTLTFNPGWDGNAQPLESFTDVRELQRQLKESGLTIATEVDESGPGPGFVIVADPDGNPIFIDQHV